MNKFYLLKSIPVIILACLLLVIILGALVLWPKFQDLTIHQKMIEEKRAEIQYKKEYFQELKEIDTKLAEYPEVLSKIEASLPDDPSLPSLLNFLQKASSQSGLILKGISPFTLSKSEDFSNLQTTQFSLQVAGSYSSFKNFLSNLEKSARMIEVESISFSTPEKGDLFTFSLRIKTYSY